MREMTKLITSLITIFFISKLVLAGDPSVITNSTLIKQSSKQQTTKRLSPSKGGFPTKVSINRVIEGRISLSGNCAATERDISINISASKRNWNVVARRDPNNDFGFLYRFDRLPEGIYTVAPEPSIGHCPGGSWTPRTLRVDLRGVVRATRDFNYSVRLSEARLNLGVATSQIRHEFRGTQIHLSNYRPSDRPSFIHLGEGLGGREFQFEIPAYKYGKRIRYYVNNINLSDIRVGTEGGAFKISLLFEETGVEIKGRCRGCVAGSDDSAPDAHIHDFQIDVLLTPAMFTGGRGANADLSFSDVRVRTRLRTDIRGICDVLECGPFERYIDRQVKVQIEQAVQEMIDNRTIRAAVARALRPTLDGLGIGTIQGVSVQGGSLVIRHLPA